MLFGLSVLKRTYGQALRQNSGCDFSNQDATESFDDLGLVSRGMIDSSHILSD